jgi:hypothetical protein
MRRDAFVNAGRERHCQHRIGTFVTIARVERYDHNGPSPLVRWINMQPDKPDLAAEWSFRWHSGALLVRELPLSEVSPFGLLRCLFIR